MTYRQAKVLGIVVTVTYCLLACARAQDNSVTIPLGDRPVTISHTTTKTATGKGNAVDVSGDKAAVNDLAMKAPEVRQGSQSASGGDTSGDFTSSVTGSAGWRWACGIFGALLIAAGILGGAKLGWSFKTLCGCVVVGALCIGVAIWPPLGMLLLAGGLVLSVGFWLLETHGGATALKAMKSAFVRGEAIRANNVSVKQGMADTAKLAAIPPLHPLAQKVLDEVKIT